MALALLTYRGDFSSLAALSCQVVRTELRFKPQYPYQAETFCIGFRPTVVTDRTIFQ